MLENLALVERLTAWKRGCMASTMNRTTESTEEAWNNNIEDHELTRKEKKSREVHMADALTKAEAVKKPIWQRNKQWTSV